MNPVKASPYLGVMIQQFYSDVVGTTHWSAHERIGQRLAREHTTREACKSPVGALKKKNRGKDCATALNRAAENSIVR